MTSTAVTTEKHIDWTSGKAERIKGTRGLLTEKLLQQFPARPELPFPAVTDSINEILDRLDGPPFRTLGSRDHQRRTTRLLLKWLENFPGETWQQRWDASRSEDRKMDWATAPRDWFAAQGAKTVPGDFLAGLLKLTILNVMRPSMGFLMLINRYRHWVNAVAAHRDPAGFAHLRTSSDPKLWESQGWNTARWQISIMLLTKGGHIGDITVGDCVEMRLSDLTTPKGHKPHRYLFYVMLYSAGVFPAGAPATLRAVSMHGGQVSIERLVDRYELANREVRDLLVEYLAERQAALDYCSLEDLSRSLALHFWKNLEVHHPGVDSLRLDHQVVRAWKERLRTKIVRKRLPDGRLVEIAQPRVSHLQILTMVRAFYLDLAQWATEDPARWARWASPCPISTDEIAHKKAASRRKSRMDQRTRERLPLLPALVSAAEQRAREARIRLDAALEDTTAKTFTALGETFTRRELSIPVGRGPNLGRRKTGVIDSVGASRDLRSEENRAFWAWAAVEFLRHTGARIEEMLETSHHSIIQYRLPTTGELIPLLQIAPSKTDQERLLVITPELADVLSTIIARVRQKDGTIPLVPFYDQAEKVWSAPAPLLFQWQHGPHSRALSTSTIRKAIREIFEATGLKDVDGQPLYFLPHDFRRIFATEAILNGMPPHIAQLLMGHKDISSTMGYKAVYPQEAIDGHRAFISRRRTLRPSEEYRTPTDAEWEEFLGHFERRKVALGECGRAYGTSCQHEHSCIRCPVLRVDPAQRGRLEQIRDNLTLRIDEAEREGWLGEAEGLRVSLSAASEKLTQLDDRARRANTVFLSIPAFPEIASGTITLPTKPQPSTGPDHARTPHDSHQLAPRRDARRIPPKQKPPRQ